MKNTSSLRRWITLFSVTACLALWGCPNPNAIGVQTYGTVVVTCVQASNGQPVSGAIVSAPAPNGEATQSTDSSGRTTFDKVPIGTHAITADAPGLHGDTTVSVTENAQVQAKISMSPTQ